MKSITLIICYCAALFLLVAGCATTEEAIQTSTNSALERDREIGSKDGRTPQQVIKSIDSSSWKADPTQYGMTAMEYQMAIAEQFFKTQIERAGGINQWNHFPALAKAADRWVVSSNIDAMFSMSIVDARKGFTVTLPDVGERFISIHVNDQYHTSVDYNWSAGKHTYKGEDIDTDYVFVAIRIGTDGTEADQQLIRQDIQSRLAIESNSAVPFKTQFDPVLMEKIRKQMMVQYEDLDDTYGTVKYDIRAVDQWEKWTYTITAGYGLAPENASMYSVFSPKGTKGNVCYEASFDKVPAKAFFSLTAYNFDKYMMSDKYNIISSNRPNLITRSDGGFDVIFGGMECKKIADERGVNFMYTPDDGWSCLLRAYRPDVEKMYNYKMPELKEIKH